MLAVGREGGGGYIKNAGDTATAEATLATFH